MSGMKKDNILPTNINRPEKQPWHLLHGFLVISAFLFAAHCVLGRSHLLFYTTGAISPTKFLGPIPPNENSSSCPQFAPIMPLCHAILDHTLDAVYASDEFKLKVYDSFGRAIRIPTESFDHVIQRQELKMHSTFDDFHSFLEAAFPLIYANLRVTKINTYGLVFHWQGSDPSLKPIMLAAHQDVVPVNSGTLDLWEHPPFSGHYDGEWIWGRGTEDDKGDLVEQMTAVESLIEHGFEPSRSIILAYGFDEEIGGPEGATHIAKYLEKTYGRDGIAMILDEGAGYSEALGGGVLFATPAISEKGYFDLKIEVSTQGGHASSPPAHTSIGLLSRLIVAIEDHPHKPKLSRSSTAFTVAQCHATYGPEYPSELRTLAFAALANDKALDDLQSGLIKANPLYAAMLGTTQAVDVIEGGVKINALPERATAIVDNRIVEHSSLAELQLHIIETLVPVAVLYNLTLDAFGDTGTRALSGVGHITLREASNARTEPSPITPIGSGTPYHLLAGAIKAEISSRQGHNVTGVIVTPSPVLGNTDTRHYWNLTKHILRYSPRNAADSNGGEHTVNEAVRAESVVEGIRFFTKLILNSDEMLFLL